MDTPADLAPRHVLSFRLQPDERASGFNARCMTCGALFEHFDDTDGVCCPPVRGEKARDERD